VCGNNNRGTQRGGWCFACERTLFDCGRLPRYVRLRKAQVVPCGKKRKAETDFSSHSDNLCKGKSARLSAHGHAISPRIPTNPKDGIALADIHNAPKRVAWPPWIGSVPLRPSNIHPSIRRRESLMADRATLLAIVVLPQSFVSTQHLSTRDSPRPNERRG